MRIKIVLRTPTDGLFVPYDYQYFITASIYRKLFLSDPYFAEFLHQQGYSRKRYKLFCFSHLQAQRKKGTADGFWIVGDAWIIIGSPLVQFCYHFLRGVTLEPQLELGELKLDVKEVLTQEVSVAGNSARFLCLSPIVVTGVSDAGRRPADYLRYEENPALFSEKIRQNLLRRYQACYNNLPEDDRFFFFFDHVYLKEKGGTKLIQYRDQNILCYLAPLQLEGSAELVRFAWEAGLGEKNSMGFGCVEILGKRPSWQVFVVDPQ